MGNRRRDLDYEIISQNRSGFQGLQERSRQRFFSRLSSGKGNIIFLLYSS